MSHFSEQNDHIIRLSHFTMEYAPDAIFWVDSEARIHRVNEMACRLFGYSADEFLHKKVYELHPDENADTWGKRWNTLKEHKVITFEKFQPTKNGRWIPVEVTQNFIEFEGQEYSCNFVRDVTARKHAENELQESQRTLQTLIHNLPGAVYRCKHDQHLTVEFITAWSQRITGYAPEDLIFNKKISRMALVHPEDQKRVFNEYQEALKERRPGRLNYRILTLDGDIKWISDRFRGVYSETNEVVAVEGFFNDITQQIEAEKELTQALLEVEYLKNRLEEENIYLRQEIKLTYNFENIHSQSEKYKQVLAQVEQVAATDATVLILGETGTGKELVAHAVHNLSMRRERPLVKVNCAVLPANLIESELFGHEKGAFTGAIARKVGRFELADGSSIFLDEIGELPLDLQAKLLRVLQEGEFDRLGNPHTLKVNARVIAATNRDLEKAVQNGTFREDLYYRLNVFPIHIPPLRDRPEDIPLLVKYFTQKFSKKTGKQIERVPRKVMTILQEYPWPGNIRELENIIERAVILSPGTRLELGDWFSAKEPQSKSIKLATLEEAERAHILKALKKTYWRVSGEKGAAKILNINPQTLVSRMKKLGIERPA